MSEERTNYLEPAGSPRERAIARIIRRDRRAKVMDAIDDLVATRFQRLKLKKELKSMESKISGLQDFISENNKDAHG